LAPDDKKKMLKVLLVLFLLSSHPSDAAGVSNDILVFKFDEKYMQTFG
jgi:hypothetical protein